MVQIDMTDEPPREPGPASDFLSDGGTAVHNVFNLAAHYQQIRRRRGPNEAIIAVATTILGISWHLLSSGEIYHDVGADHFHTRDRDGQTRRLIRRLEPFGYQVTLEDTAV